MKGQDKNRGVDRWSDDQWSVVERDNNQPVILAWPSKNKSERQGKGKRRDQKSGMFLILFFQNHNIQLCCWEKVIVQPKLEYCSRFDLVGRAMTFRVLSLYNMIWGTQDWIGLDWIGLDWIGLDWIGLDRAKG